jgi:nicotinate-nucleotide adenylyltransferase
MSRIGILGGTFNPIHNGHIMLAQYCKNEVQLDKIILVPTCTPPHKSNKHLADESHRLKMCSLASNGIKGFEVSDVEIRRKGKSYTYETLSYFKEIYPDDELYFIMGADMFLSLPKWYRAEELMKNFKFIAIDREGSFQEKKEQFDKVVALTDATFINVKTPEISSTMVRDAVKAGKSISEFVPKAVEDYIHEHGLYKGE